METTKGTAMATEERAGGRPGSAFLYLVWCEIVKLTRLPLFVFPTALFPIMFFAFFGLPNIGNEIDGISAGPYILASYGAYSVLSVALFSFGVSIAAERGLGWNRLLRVTPLEPRVFFAAKVVMAMLFGCATLALLFTFGAVVGVRMPALRWLELVGLLLVGMIPFVALGLWIGYVAGPNSAAAVANLIFLPLSFASGLFVPLDFLPDVVRAAAPYLPAYHVGQLGWTLLGAGDGRGLGVHLLWLAGYTAAFLALAVVAYRRDEGKHYG
jgi:ABC-2 type transport system permease protein